MTNCVQDSAWYSYTSSTQTMKTWARVLTSYEDVPEAFREAFPTFEDTFPYTVFIPEDRLSLFHKRTGKVLCLYPDRFVLLEALRDQVKSISSPLADVLYVEQGRILLSSWLTVKTLSDTFTIRFNTTNIHSFTPVIEAIRKATSSLSSPLGRQSGSDEQELAKFNYLNSLNYKYMNFGRQSVRPGDEVRNILYQAPRCLQAITFLKKVLFKRYATSHLSILTDAELILIKEQKRTKSDDKNIYGGVFTYLPLQNVQDIQLTTDPEHSHRTMDIMLSDGGKLRPEFSLDNTGLDDFYVTWKQQHSG